MRKLFTKTPPVLLSIFLVFLFFAPHLLKKELPIPADSVVGLYHPFRDNSYLGFSALHFPTKNPLITDPVIQTYPWRFLVIDNLKKLHLPLWNPYSFSGQPLLANLQSGMLQMTNIFYFATPFNFAWILQIILSLVLSSIFMYLFLSTSKISKIASAYGALVFPFTGYMVVWLTWGTVVTTALWLPLILFCFNKIFEKLSAFYFLLLTFAVFQTLVSGHIQTALYIFLVSLFYLLYKYLTTKQIKPILLVLASFVIGSLISALQLLPALEFSVLSNRVADHAFSPQRKDWFLPFQNIIQLFAPDFFGNPTTYNYWGIWNYAEFVSYLGIFPLFFALIAFFKRSSLTKLFIVLSIVSLVLAFKNPVSLLPYLLKVPFISSMQPSRIIFVLEFALSVLSAIGVDYFIKEKFRKKTVIPALFILLSILVLIFISKFNKAVFPSSVEIDAAYVGFRNLLVPLILSAVIFLLIFLKGIKFQSKLLLIFIFTVTTIDLFRFAYKFTPFSNLNIIFPSTRTTDFLKSQSKPFRVMETDRRILNGNISSVYKIEQVSGYDPLYLKSYAQLVSSWQSKKAQPPGSFDRIVTPQDFSLPLTNFMNVKYILTFDDIDNQNFKRVLQEGQTKVYENKGVLPRAYFVNDVRLVNGQDEELNEITGKNFDFNTQAVSREFQFQTNSNASATIKSYDDQGITISTQSDGQAPLVVSNVLYPGWKAYIDGQEQPLKEVNFMFQSVIVPAGKHMVEVVYSPNSFFYGLYISILGFVSALFVAAFLWKKNYR